MSLVTRCPKCSTMFRVVPDQLRISAGWVRCGHCQEVFDAAQHMLPRSSGQEALQPPREPEAADAPIPDGASLLQRPEGAQPYAQLPGPGADAASGTALLRYSSPQTLYKKGSSAAAPAEDFVAALDAARAASRDEADGALVAIAELDAAPGADADAAPAPGQVDFLLSDLGCELDERGMAPSFVQRARRRRRQPQSAGMRALFWFVLAALMLSLVLQVLIGERNWLAARQPALAPALRGLCSVFNCRVGPYQHIEAIIIDNSGFSRAADGSFLFHYTLRNQANLPVATPALELTLTDVQERPLVRRVITQPELGAPASIAARSEFSGARTITVSTTANPSAISGYKLVAFYP